MLHHGIGKLNDIDAFAMAVVKPYFPFLPGSPQVWTVLAAVIGIVGSFCLALGILVRPMALLLLGTMFNAVYYQLVTKGWQNYPLDPDSGGSYTFEPSLAYLGICLCVALVGPGRLAVKTKLDSHIELLHKLEWSWSDIGLLVLRVNTALLMVHHGLDKLSDADTFANGTVAVYFTFLPGSPFFWTYLSAGIEIVGSACWIAGLLTRPAAALIAGTM